MQTSCPECGTSFRVSQEQLGLRRGLVRCGRCNAVFNAYDTLLPELEGAPAEPQGGVTPEAQLEAQPVTNAHLAAPPSATSEVDVPPETGHQAQGFQPSPPSSEASVWDEVEADLAMPSDLPDVPPRDALAAYLETAVTHLPPDADQEIDLSQAEGRWPMSDAPEMAMAQPEDQTSTYLDQPSGQPLDQSPDTQPADLPENPPETPPETPSAAESPDAILLSDPHQKAKEGTGLAKWKIGLYVMAILLLTLALVAQLAYFLRGELAAAMPDARPTLEALCRPLGCVVPMPKQLTRQAILSSSLEHDSEQKSRVRLTFLLANRTNQTQTWPHIRLTLSDVRESPVAQKALAPEDYLPKGVSARAGFPPQSEQEVRLELDIGNLSAASYLLNVTYP